MFYQEAEKFINEVFWKETHDPRSKLNIAELVNAKLVKDNNEKDPDYFQKRIGVVHASQIYSCLRGVIHSCLRHTPDKEPEPRKLGIFKAGLLFEDFIIDSLGERVIGRQREYKFRYKNITLVGRSDYRIDDGGIIRIGENKSVHSDSFWYRQREGTLIQWHNQIQLQIYMWLERVLFDEKVEGIFSYISKDDCMVESAPVKFNQRVIDEIVIPALDIINEGFEKQDPNIAPLPEIAIYSESREQYQKNWLCTYCDYHNQCAGAGWLLEAGELVARKNKEIKQGLKDSVGHITKKSKSEIHPV